MMYELKWVEKSMHLQEPDVPGDAAMLSLSWIAADYLARIKIKCHGVAHIESTKPINSLSRYLADQM
ncbi:hypothetical protein ACFXTH_012743 [Malus domestica]